MLGRFGSLLGLIVLCSLLAASNEQFRSFTNYLLLLQQAAPIAIIAVGQTFVILTGGIDLSVGSLTAFTSVCMALFMTGGASHAHPLSPWIAIALGILIATAVGGAQGVLITKLRMPPFIVTLGSPASRSCSVTGRRSASTEKVGIGCTAATSAR